MKNYINVFHSMLNEIEGWNNLTLVEKSALIKNYLNMNEKVDKLSEYFDKYLNFLSKKPFNLFVKSVINAEFLIMAVPKRKTSKSRAGKRRSHIKVSSKNIY